MFLQDCLVGRVVASATAEHKVLSSIPESGKLMLGFPIRNVSVVAGICARLMAIGSPPITWDLNITGEIWVYYKLGTP